MVRKTGDPRKRKPKITFSKAGLAQTGKKTIRDREGHAWTHVMTVDEPESKRIRLFYTRVKKEFKIVKDGTNYQIFVRKG